MVLKTRSQLIHSGLTSVTCSSESEEKEDGTLLKTRKSQAQKMLTRLP